MRTRPRIFLWMATIGLLLILTSLSLLSFRHGPATVAQAETGALLQAVTVPASAQCSIGTSVAVVPGLSIGLLQYPILLVTSCLGGNSLYFLDPTTTPATLVKTIQTTNTPPLGWGSLSLRGD